MEQKSWNGVTILSRNPDFTEVGRGLPSDPEDVQSRYIEAVINGIRICCLYVPNGNPAPGPKFNYKLRWLDGLLVKSEKLLALNQAVVLAGDFNIIPTDLDVYKPDRWIKDALFRPEIQHFFHQLIELGWTDALQALYPDQKFYTFWDHFRNSFGKDAGLRIDHFLIRPELRGKLKKGGIDKAFRSWEKSSDHAPVWIEIDI